MNLPDKIAAANVLAFYLDNSFVVLADELRERGWSDLIGDPDFDRLLADRAFCCRECGGWSAVAEESGRPPRCPDHGRYRA